MHPLRASKGVGAMVALLAAATAGCNTALFQQSKPFPPGPMTDLMYPKDIKGGPVAPISSHETADIVEPLLEHRTMYARCLQALHGYYDESGFLGKARWAATELRDLQHVPAYTYGADVGQLRVRDIDVAGAREVDLVEQLTMHRKMYNRLLRILIRHLAEKQDYENLKCAERENLELTYVKPYQYLMDATIPIASLHPQESIADADKLYDEGWALMKKGGHGVPAFYNRRYMVQALNKFHTLITEYPTSDKIAEAAYWCGYVHKEYFYDVAQNEDDNEIAVQYFQRAYTWKPDIRLQARFEAAAVYDYRLHDRERALRLYRDVIEHETFVKSNVEFANKRISELTAELHQEVGAEPGRVVKAPPADSDDEEDAREASPPGPDVPEPEATSERPIAP